MVRLYAEFGITATDRLENLRPANRVEIRCWKPWRPLTVDNLLPEFAKSERSAMPAPKEIEVKLELPSASLPRFKKIPLLRAQNGRAKSTAEVSVYFDTDKHKLHKKGMMLRVRRSGDRYIQTIKSALEHRDRSRATNNGKAKSRDEHLTCVWRRTPPSRR